MAVGAAIFLCFSPWRLGVLAIAARFPSKQATAYAWSLAGNTAALLIVCSVLRHTAGIDRGSLFFAWLLWTAALAWFARSGKVGADAHRHKRRGRTMCDTAGYTG